MRITFETDGGFAIFPGLSKPTVIENNELNGDEPQQLSRLIENAKFFERSADTTKYSAAQRGADQRSYSLTIEDGKQKRHLTLTDPITDANLKSLVDFVRAKTLAKRSAQAKETTSETENKAKKAIKKQK